MVREVSPDPTRTPSVSQCDQASRNAAIGVSRNTSRPVARPIITAIAVMAIATITTGPIAGE